MHDAVLLGVLLAAIAIGFGLGIRYAYRRQQHSPPRVLPAYHGNTSSG